MSNQVVLLKSQKQLLEQARKLKLDGIVNELEEQFSTPNLFTDMPLEERLKRCFDRQLDVASIAKFNSLFRKSKIRSKLYIRQFRPDPGRGLDADLLLMLKEGDFIDKGINIIISGPTGTGKTALASAAGVEAMSKGHSVLFFRMNDLITIIENKDKLGLARFKERLKRIKLLIIDDYGLTTLSDNAVNGLMEIADIRYAIGSTIFTTQLKKKSLLSVVDRSPIRDALGDRLFRECDKEIVLLGESWRGSNEELIGVRDAE